MKAEWNSPCWLIEREGEREGGRLSLGVREISSMILEASFYTLEVSVEDPLDLDCLKRLTTEVSE
jgi:hypothetical protein